MQSPPPMDLHMVRSVIVSLEAALAHFRSLEQSLVAAHPGPAAAHPGPAVRSRSRSPPSVSAANRSQIPLASSYQVVAVAPNTRCYCADNPNMDACEKIAVRVGYLKRKKQATHNMCAVCWDWNREMGNLAPPV